MVLALERKRPTVPDILVRLMEIAEQRKVPLVITYDERRVGWCFEARCEPFVAVHPLLPLALEQVLEQITRELAS